MHAIEAGTLPYKINTKTMAQVHRNPLLFLLIKIDKKKMISKQDEKMKLKGKKKQLHPTLPGWHVIQVQPPPVQSA